MPGRRAILAMLPALLVAAAGCVQTQTLLPPTNAKFISGEQHFLAGNFREAKVFFSQYLETGASALGETRTQYWLGRCDLALKNFDEAVEHFSAALASPEDWVTANSLAGQGIAFIYMGRYPEAIAALKESLQFTGAVRKDDVLMKLATAYIRSGQWKMAEAVLNRLVVECAGSDLIDPANEISEYMRERKFVIQAGAFRTPIAAKTYKKRLTARGFDAEVLKTVRNGRPFFAVIIGKYDSYTDAAHAAARLRHSGKFRELIIKP